MYPVAIWHLPDLDGRTRQLMLNELADDSANGLCYLGKRLNGAGRAAFPKLLHTALSSGTPSTLQRALEPVPGYLWQISALGARGVDRKTAVDAASTLAGGEFNRYYMRAICSRAMQDGLTAVQVFRAKDVAVARSGGAQVGQLLDPADAFRDVKLDGIVRPITGMPHGPNSGVSLRLVTAEVASLLRRAV